jgi:hypothetical protein
MITEIPTHEEFHASGVNQLYLAWQIALQALQDVDEYDRWAAEEGQYNKEDATAAASLYWSKLQPALANALGLIQQSVEMALKGRIAKISPFLLISGDPKSWPNDDKPFSDFRTLDAIDLVKVHNTFCSPRLDDNFQKFWETVRRNRNIIMHSVSRMTFHPKELVRDILVVAEALFAEVRWPERLLGLAADNKYTTHWLDLNSHEPVVRQVDMAWRHLTPAERKHYLGFEKGRRRYLCPVCLPKMGPDCWDDGVGPPKLAQLKSKMEREAALWCIVCNEHTIVEREKCCVSACKTNVLSSSVCLSCGCRQDSPDRFVSGLEINEGGHGDLFEFNFHNPRHNHISEKELASPRDAIEHARLAMLAPYLAGWYAVIVIFKSQETGSFSAVGNWQRKSGDLVWRAGGDPWDIDEAV